MTATAGVAAMVNMMAVMATAMALQWLLVDILVVVVAPAMTAVMRGSGNGQEWQGGRWRHQQQQQWQAWRWRRGGDLQGYWLWPLAITYLLIV